MLGGSLGVWICALAIFGSDYPTNYDSVNYALAIKRDFNIGKCQPHAYGYIYHVIMSRLWLPLIGNPFRVQQAQNILYLVVGCAAMIPWGRPRMTYCVIVAATLPLSLYFSSASVIHGALFMAGALLARLVLQLEQEKIHPLLLTTFFFILVGFRQDVGLFMGLMVIVALIRHKCGLRVWIAATTSGLALTAIWYIATSWSSGWVSPWKEANIIAFPFIRNSSPFFGATPFQWARSSIRFLLYIPATLGPGGIGAILHAIKKSGRYDALMLSIAILPFMIFGILLHIGVAGYYALITGFIFAWFSLRNVSGLRFTSAGTFAILNLVFFLTVPAPFSGDHDTFTSRPLIESLAKQASYLGAAGLSAVTANREWEKFLESTLAPSPVFGALDSIEYDGIPYFRIWDILAEKWKNRYTTSVDSADLLIGYIDDSTAATSFAKRFGRIGVRGRQ